MKGYKAFNKGLICKNKKYAENTIFEESEAIPCRSGMHFCENPMDMLKYYELVSEDGEIPEFAEVESLDTPKTYDAEKFCTKKLEVHEKISFEKFIDACMNSLLERIDNISSENNYCSFIPSENFWESELRLVNQEDCSRINNSEYYARLTNLGKNSKLISTGDHSSLINIGDDSKLASLGHTSHFANAGNRTQIINSGKYLKLANSGSHSLIANSGMCASIANAGYFSQLANSGNESDIANSGINSRIANSGDYSRIANSGDSSRIVSDGNRSQIISAGDHSCINSKGEHSIVCCTGDFSIVKAKKGSWITLAEWEYKDGEKVPKCVKTEYVDGERIKEDTFYMLRDGKFVEVKG